MSWLCTFGLFQRLPVPQVAVYLCERGGGGVGVLFLWQPQLLGFWGGWKGRQKGKAGQNWAVCVLVVVGGHLEAPTGSDG